jgi:hypothetical protein
MNIYMLTFTDIYDERYIIADIELRGDCHRMILKNGDNVVSPNNSISNANRVFVLLVSNHFVLKKW